MGLHDDLMGDSTSVHHSTFGEVVTYSSDSGSLIELQNVIVGHEYNERRYNENGYEYVRSRTFEIVTDSDSEMYSGSESITPNGYIEFGGIRYGIERVSEATTVGTAVAHCVSRMPGRRTKEGLRGRN